LGTAYRLHLLPILRLCHSLIDGGPRSEAKESIGLRVPDSFTGCELYDISKSVFTELLAKEIDAGVAILTWVQATNIYIHDIDSSGSRIPGAEMIQFMEQCERVWL
jgi:hypothetical protein